MKGRYFKEIHNVKAHLISLYIVIILLTGIAFYALTGWKAAPSHIRVYIPPDLRAGGVFEIGEVPTSVIYVFTHYIFQQLNTWREDGRQDYADNIFKLKSYMTPAFQIQIQSDHKLRAQLGELSNRTRRVQEIPGAAFSEGRVNVDGPGRWTVTLDYEIVERVNQVPVKITQVRYQLRIVKYNIDPEYNPWGLAIDGFAAPPQRLKEEEVN